jgi:hypothetical protein
MPKIAMGIFKDKNFWFKSFGDVMADAIIKKVKPKGRIMFVHCTSHSDDRQCMQLMGDKMAGQGFEVIYGAVDHVKFIDNKATSILSGNEGGIDCIVRFTPLEWFIGIKPKRWHGFFDTITPSCNHPIGMYAQTKRFPFAWGGLEKMGVDLSVWRALLPETIPTKDARGRDGFIFKPTCGRVGEGITIKEACRDDEYETLMKDVKRNPRQHVAQKLFKSVPLTSDEGEAFHVCLGSYSIEGKAAGYFARISDTPRIDSGALEIPVVIERGGK